MSRIDITDAQLLADIMEALGDRETEDGYTCRELQKITLWGKELTRRNVEQLIIAGAWERVQLLRTSELDNITRRVRGYRPVQSRD